MIKPEEIFVTGYKGRLGSTLVNKYKCQPFEANILSSREVQDVLNANPTMKAVINCAAKTGVDDAEDEAKYREFAQVNSSGVGNLRLMLPPKIQLVHISTDYVFSGEFGPYKEDYTAQTPVNNYGWSKLGGEVALTAFRQPKDIIIRTTGLYGRSPDLVSRVVQELQEDNPVKLTNELYGNQTYIPYLCLGILKALQLDNPPSILHVASGEVISRYEFGLLIAEVWKLDKKLIKPCWNKDIEFWKAKRSSNGGLNVDLARSLDIPIYDSIWDGLRDYKRELERG